MASSHGAVYEDDLLSCTCGWQPLGLSSEYDIEAWADHWAEVYVIPRFIAELETIKNNQEGPKEVQVLFGVEWQPGNTEYLSSEARANEVLFESEEDDAKLVKTIQFREYL